MSVDGSSPQVSSLPGQAVYSPLVLRLYDWWVLDVSCSQIWQCSADRMLRHYEEHLGDPHLDVGVGSGFFLDRARFPVAAPRITLFDLNAQSLAHTSSRIARYRPEVVQGDVLAPNSLPRSCFASVGLNFLIHCLPSGGAGKWRLFDYLAPALRPRGTIFGSTILGSPTPPRARQRALMRLYNRKGIFGNADDSLSTLRAELELRFEQVRVEQVGVVALFSGRAR